MASSRSLGASTATPSRADAPVALELAIRIYLRRCWLFGWLRNDSGRHPEDVRAEFFKGIGIVRGLLEKEVHHFNNILNGRHVAANHESRPHRATTGKVAQFWTSAILPPWRVEFGAILLASLIKRRYTSSRSEEHTSELQ